MSKMKVYKSSRIKAFVTGLLSLTMIVAGVALIAAFFFGYQLDSIATNSADPNGFNVPRLGAAQQPDVGGPEDKTLKLTVPKMSRIEDSSVPDARGDDVQTLDSNAAIHLQGTGYPWQKEANVYIAGHRLGYPSSDSFLAFFDLNKLENGDKVFVEDSTGTRYTYEVFKEFVVSPSNLSVTKPVPGKNIVTLQTCTLPDYSERLVVQAELVDVA